MKTPLIIAVAGKKLSGKTTLCKYLSAFYALHMNYPKWDLVLYQDADGIISARHKVDGALLPVFLGKSLDFDREPAITYSFATVLKSSVCTDVLGLTFEQTCGTNEEKNTLTPYFWDNLPLEIRKECSNEWEDICVGFSQIETDESGINPDVEFIEKVKKPRIGPMTAREVMQVVGTNLFRRYFSDRVWVDATFRLIQSQKPAIAFIADCRFKSEVDAVIQAGGYVIQLTRNISPGDIHQSEIDLDDYQFEKLGNHCLVINNQDKPISCKNEIALNWFTKLMDEQRKNNAGNTTVDKV